MKRLTLSMLMIAGPAAAAEGEAFFSLRNTEFIVIISFLIFIGVLLYMKIPAKLTGMLDTRAAVIKAELAEARALRDEAKELLASYDRKSREVQEQSARIVAMAKEEAQTAATQAKADLKVTIARRLAAATDRIASAEAAAVREVRERAVSVAIAAATDVLTKQMTADATSASIDDAITQIAAKLH